MILVTLPAHLRNLARVNGHVEIEIKGAPTISALLNAVEEKYPMLRGTIRDHNTHKRRAFLRYYACEKDLSLEPPETQLPETVISGKEAFLIIGSIAGG